MSVIPRGIKSRKIKEKASLVGRLSMGIIISKLFVDYLAMECVKVGWRQWRDHVSLSCYRHYQFKVVLKTLK
jgi:hypothetical protein